MAALNHPNIFGILDFGLAKQVAASQSLSQSLLATQASVQDQEVQTRTGLIMGTMGYMSPEQVRGEMVDARSDIFRLWDRTLFQ